MPKVPLIVSTFVPQDTIGSTCQESSPNTIIFPVNTN